MAKTGLLHISIRKEDPSHNALTAEASVRPGRRMYSASAAPNLIVRKNVSIMAIWAM